MTAERMMFYVRGCLVLAFVGLVGCLLPFVADLEVSKGGGASFFIGLVLLLTGLISAVVLSRQASVLKDILEPAGLLAHWVGKDDEGDDFDVTVSRRGVVCNDGVFPFCEPGCGLNGVTLTPPESPRFLSLNISVYRKGRVRKNNLEIRIPPGETDRARAIAKTLQELFSVPVANP